jgi:hypothetical protein
MSRLSLIFSRLALFFKNRRSPFTVITADTITLNLKGKKKKLSFNELLDLLQVSGFQQLKKPPPFGW